MDLVLVTLKSISKFLSDPLFLASFLIICLLLYLDNRKNVRIQKFILGMNTHSSLELTLSQIVLGILAGILGSIILSLLGVMFPENSGIEYVFLVTFLLSLWSSKYGDFILISLCFSLGTILLSILKIEIFDVNYVELFALVGIVAIILGVLTIIDGKRSSMAVFTSKNGKIIGGFAFKRIWPVAFVILIYGSFASGDSGNINTFNWWPVIDRDHILEIISKLVIAFSPVLTVFKYEAITFTMKKEEKIYLSGFTYIFQGILAIILSRICSFSIYHSLFSSLLLFSLNIGILKIKNHFEVSKEPRFISDKQGVVVLDVLKNTISHKTGIKSGDILLKINEHEIENEKDVFKYIYNGESLEFMIKRGKDIIVLKTKEIVREKFGFIIVPKKIDKEVYMLGNKYFGK